MKTTLIAFSFLLLFACESDKKKTETVEISQETEKNNQKPPIALVIHAGAGNMSPENMDSNKLVQIKKKIEDALNAGYYIMEKGGSSLDAVEACIRILED